MSAESIAPPQPLPDPDSRPFWEHTARGEFAIQRCRACRGWQFPLLESCRKCGGELAMETVSGRGAIHTFIVEHHVVVPGFEGKLPYAILTVALEEAPHARIVGALVDAEPAQARVGARVQAELVDLPGGDYRIPVFRLAD